MLKCVGLFEQYRNYTNEDAKLRYKQLKRNWFYGYYFVYFVITTCGHDVYKNPYHLYMIRILVFY